MARLDRGQLRRNGHRSRRLGHGQRARGRRLGHGRRVRAPRDATILRTASETTIPTRLHDDIGTASAGRAPGRAPHDPIAIHLEILAFALRAGASILCALLPAIAPSSGSRSPADAVHAAAGAYVLDHTIRGLDDALPADAWRELGGLDMDPEGRVYVSDAFDGRITVIEPDGSNQVLVRPGGGLVSPTHLALDLTRQRLYVSDPGAAALVMLDLSSGRVLRSQSGIPGAAGLGVAPDGSVFIASADTGRVHVFGPEGEARGSWIAAPDDEQPGVGDLLRGLDVDADGMVYVVDGRRERVTVFDAGGQRHETLRPDEGMAIDIAVEYDPQVSPRKRFWVAGERGLQRYDPRTKTWELARGPAPVALALRLGIGTATAFRGEPNRPSRVERRAYGELGGRPERSWGGAVVVPGMLDGPLGINVGADGRLYLLDLAPRIQRFDAEGGIIDQIQLADAIDSAGAADGRLFVLAQGRLLAYASDGMPLWTRPVAPYAQALAYEAAGDSLALLDADGYLLRYAASDGLTGPRLRLDAPPGPEPDWIDLAAAGDGALYALERRAPALVRLDPDGRQTSFPIGGGARRLGATPDGAALTLGRDGWVRRFAADGSPEGGFDALRFDVASASDPVDLAAGPDGRVYVVDRKAGFISRYRLEPGARPAEPPDAADGCRNYPDKTASPPLIWLGETVDVRLTLRGGCGSLASNEPLDIVLIIDESGSMTGEKIRIAREAARDFVAEVDLSISRVAVIGFDTGARRYIGLSQDASAIYRAVEQLRARGGTRIDMGLAEARDEMRRRGRPGIARPIFVLLSDGFNNAGPDPVRREADLAKRDGIEIYTIGIQADEQLMTAIATSPEHAFSPRSARFLYEVFDAIAQRITTSTLFRRLTVIDQIPTNMRYVLGSAEPPADFDPASNRLIWTLENVPFRGFGLGYTLEPLELGTWPTNVVAWGEGEDGYGRPARVDFPVPQVVVIGPTAMPSPSSTPTPTASPSPTPSPTPTRPPGPIYLPLLLREACTPRQLRADVVLMLDASSSMQGGKLAAARSAAIRFVDIVLADADPAAPAGNQVAVVGFNAEAWLAEGLTDDARRLRAAIQGLTITPGTRIDFGLAAAAEELWGPRRRPANTPTIVLLTDGLQNGAPEPAYALAAAARARGALIYSIGLGQDVDAAFLAEVAGDPSRRYLAPDPSDLEAIYAQIAGEIPCPAEAFWGRRLQGRRAGMLY